jgi:hypothetical protein
LTPGGSTHLHTNNTHTESMKNIGKNNKIKKAKENIEKNTEDKS